jgi:hypothetical protein
MGEVLKLLARVEDKFELGEERVRVESDAPVEGDEFAVDVVEDFNF